MEEIWKPFPLSEDYHVSNTGKVMSFKKFKCGSLLTGYPSSAGHQVFRLIIGTNYRAFKGEILVYMTFGDEPEHLDDESITLIHKDGNVLNNNITNLELILKSETSSKPARTSKRCETELPEDLFELEQYPGYAITKTGQVFNIESKYALSSYEYRGTKTVTIDFNGKPLKISIAKTLAKLFTPNPDEKPHISFKDGDKMNISLDNIEWVGASATMKRYKHEEKIKALETLKDIFVYDLRYNLLSKEISIKAAQDKYGVILPIFLTDDNKGYVFGGMRFSYHELVSPRPEGEWKQYSEHSDLEISKDGRVYSWKSLKLLERKKARPEYCRIQIIEGTNRREHVFHVGKQVEKLFG